MTSLTGWKALRTFRGKCGQVLTWPPAQVRSTPAHAATPLSRRFPSSRQSCRSHRKRLPSENSPLRTAPRSSTAPRAKEHTSSPSRTHSTPTPTPERTHPLHSDRTPSSPASLCSVPAFAGEAHRRERAGPDCPRCCGSAGVRPSGVPRGRAVLCADSPRDPRALWGAGLTYRPSVRAVREMTAHPLRTPKAAAPLLQPGTSVPDPGAPAGRSDPLGQTQLGIRLCSHIIPAV